MITEGNVLVIDDEVQIRRLLQITLNANNYNTTVASTGREGLVSAATQHPDLILLDLGLPDTDGLDLLKELRQWYTKPIMILSVRNNEEDIIKALDSGANDYLTKPFRTGEFLARIRLALRLNQHRSDNPVMNFGSLSIDLISHTAYKNNELLKLTTTEFSLLSLLARNSGRVMTHTQILKEVWGHGYTEQTQYLRVFVAQLRKKIEDQPSRPTLLITESGIGYRFAENPATDE